MSAALLGMSVGSGVGGWLGDRIGRKSVLVAATLSFAIATALASVTTSVVQMALLRATERDRVRRRFCRMRSPWPASGCLTAHRARSASLLSVGVPLGGLIGAGGLIFLLPMVGWKGAFIACGALTFGLGAMMWSRSRNRGRFC